MYKIGNSKTHGEGLIASKFIPKGTTIMEDPIIIKVNRRVPVDNFGVYHINMSQTAMNVDAIRAYQALSSEQKQKFNQLHVQRELLIPHVSKEQYDILRIYHNCKFQFSSYDAIGLTIAKVNHSWLANVYVTYGNVPYDNFTVIALENIEPGEETYINYAADIHYALMSKRNRQRCQSKQLWFRCAPRLTSAPAMHGNAEGFM